MKKVAIVILNWNGRALLQRFLPSVLEHSQGEGVEFIVADNASTDDSVSFLNEFYPAIRLIKLDKNYGFAGGYNEALTKIEAEYVVLLNSDVEVTPGWLTCLLKAMEADPAIAAAQPKLHAWVERTKFEYAGAAGGFLDKYGYPFCRGRVLSIVEEDCGQYDGGDQDILWATGACLMIRKSVYEEAGGLDTGFFAHQEEIDLCWRLKSRGYRIVCVPQSIVYHVGGGTLHMENPRKTFLNFRNNLLMLYKNLSEERLSSVMRVRFFLDYLAAIQYIMKGQLKNAMAVYSARKAFFAMRKAYEVQRKENQAKAISRMIPQLYEGSVLVAFYLQRKKTFTALMKKK